MPFRRIELIVDDAASPDLDAVLIEHEVIDRYVMAADASSRTIFLIDESRTEAIVDALSDRFGGDGSFSLAIYEVAGLLPRREQDESSQQPPPPADEPSPTGNGGFGRRVSREELLDDLAPGSRTDAVYLAQVFISCLVAAVGMIRDNVALVIAAMVIAPLLLPNMSLALGTTLGDLAMVRRSMRTAVLGLAVGLGLSVAVGFGIPFDPSVREIATRGEVRFSDLLVALAAGAAGALAVTTGVSANLIGVMVAVALVPPLVAVGLLLGHGDVAGAGAATVLLATNLVCVNLAAMGVFLAQGIRPSTWCEQANARRATRIAIICWLGLLGTLAALIFYFADTVPLGTRP